MGREVDDSDGTNGAEGSAARPIHPTSGRPPAIFAVIAVHNRVEQTLRCLRSLSAGSVVATAVVVDDGSTDGTAEAVARAFSDAVVLRGDGNLWWAGATNRGVEYALAHDADYVLTLNNDSVLAPSAVEALLEADCGVGLSLRCSQREDLDHPNRLPVGGIVFDWTTVGGIRQVPVGGDQPVLVDASGANSMLVPRQCFDDIGLFDADALPQCFADWDFQLRAKHKGWQVYSVPKSVVFEDRSTLGPRVRRTVSIGQAFYLVTSRRSPLFPPYPWRFFRRHAPMRRLPVILGWRYLRLVIAVARFYVPHRRPARSPGNRTRSG